MKITYYKELDGVRGIAALMVVFFHFSQSLNGSTHLLSLQKYFKIGQTGVSLFFVLSGFLITRILLNSNKKDKYFYNFYIRRSLRIFPLYYFYLLAAYFIFPLLNSEPIPEFRHQVYYWLYFQDFALTFKWNSVGPFHFWSLAVEEHFYLFWPLVIYFNNFKRITVCIFTVIVLAFLTRVVLVYHGYDFFYFTFARFDEIALGALLAVLEARKKLTSKNSNLFLLLLTLIAIPAIFTWLISTNSSHSILQTTKYILISLVYFLFIAYVLTVDQNHFLKKILKTKGLLYTGKISYGIYVYHPLSYFLFVALFDSENLLFNFIGGLLTTYAIASLSFHLFENRFLSYKRLFYSNTNEFKDNPTISIDHNAGSKEIIKTI